MRAVQNLRSMLDCEFAAMESESCDEDEPTPCTVCYVYSFDEEIPEINCVCGATFHKQCLQDLFISVGNHGLRRCVECPNCQMVRFLGKLAKKAQTCENSTQYY